MNLHRLGKEIILFVSLSALFMCNLSMSSCQDEEEKTKLSREERERLRKEDSLSLKIAVLPTADCDAVRLADSLHIFDSLGVVVHLKNYGSLSECRIALRSHLVEGAFIDSVVAKTIETKDTTALTLGPSTSLSWDLLSSKKARVVRTDQLADKIIAADSHGVTKQYAQFVVDSLSRSKKTVYVVQCEDVKIRLKMLNNGSVDAAYLPEPFSSEALKSGARLLKKQSEKKKGVVAFRSASLKDKRINGQYQLFLKGYSIALDSLAARNARSKK